MLGAAVLLGVAIVVEVAATAALPRAEGFTNLPWTGLVLTGYAASIWLLTVVVQQIPVSVAYAVWSGVGTALVAVIAVLVLHEPVNLVKALSLTLIVLGAVGLNLTGTH